MVRSDHLKKCLREKKGAYKIKFHVLNPPRGLPRGGFTVRKKIAFQFAR